MRAVKVLIMLVSVAALVACAGPDGTSPSPAPVPSTSIPTTPPSSEGEALAAYKGMWEAFGIAARTSDWQSADLARYASGYALEQLVTSLQTDQVAGIVTTGTFTTSPVVLSATPTVVQLQDCGDGSQTTKVRASDGKELPGGQGKGRHKIDAEVRNEGGWKVVDFRLRAAGTC